MQSFKAHAGYTNPQKVFSFKYLYTFQTQTSLIMPPTILNPVSPPSTWMTFVGRIQVIQVH